MRAKVHQNLIWFPNVDYMAILLFPHLPHTRVNRSQGWEQYVKRYQLIFSNDIA